ncbi:hypothetical protein AX768_30660 (plasmid) [Burkholderia sp. PAMC 28687]|nr:hypothetical protein AX768_30660 [Burkholderia sp. PAMC 28687]
MVIQNGFALFTPVLPFQVAEVITPDDDAPSVQSPYRTFNPTTGVSAPVPRISTLILAETFRLDFFLPMGTTGSQVPYQSLNQSQAAFVPDADWAVSRHRPILSRSK